MWTRLNPLTEEELLDVGTRTKALVPWADTRACAPVDLQVVLQAVPRLVAEVRELRASRRRILVWLLFLSLLMLFGRVDGLFRP